MISMQEQRARQNEEAKDDTNGAGGAGALVNNADAAMDDGEDSHDEDYYIQQAMQLSLAESNPTEKPATMTGGGEA